MRFSELVYEASPMIGQQTTQTPMNAPAAVTTAGQTPVVTPQQQTAIAAKAKLDQRTQLQNQLKAAREAVVAAQQNVTKIQNELAKIA